MAHKEHPEYRLEPKVAEAYRSEAARTLTRLSQLESAQQPLQAPMADLERVFTEDGLAGMFL